MLITRELEKVVIDLAKQYPIVTITGPRQSGKTTLVKKLFSERQYINLENPDQREFAKLDPRAFLKSVSDGAILDEIQRVPDLLSYLQEIVDTQQKMGQFILTGSNQFTLLNQLTQSLAGRSVLLKLLPFSMREIDERTKDFTTDDLLFTGFYPGIYQENRNPTIAYRSYYETYIERDLRQLSQIKDLDLFQRFVRLCAGRIGQIFNASHLSNEVGVSVPTIKSWLSILQASYVVMSLPPFYENINKRLTKSAKLYFYDVGLATYLLGIESPLQLCRDPLRGALFENLVVMELVKLRFNQGRDPNLYFYRDSHQNEVDLVFRSGTTLIPIEIKSAQTFHSDFLKGLNYFDKLFPGRVNQGFVVYDGAIGQSLHQFEVVKLRNVARIFKA
ncbi:ATP-binding protein [candidate division KSB1 bacterium]|nr:ATP-binding protein [candidate division KSB1 bacterium]